MVLPNPNSGQFTLDFEGDKSELLTVDIYNISGSCVLSEKWNTAAGINRKQFNVGSFAKGVYIVNVSSAEGSVKIKTIVQ